MRYYLGDVEQMYFFLMKKSFSQKMKNCVLLIVVYRANTNIGGVHILRRQKIGIFWPPPIPSVDSLFTKHYILV